MLKYDFIIYLILYVTLQTAHASDLPIYIANVVSDTEYSYSKTLADIHNGEKWGWHSGRIGKENASNTLEKTKVASYNISNVTDLNLKTAWIEGDDGYGIGTSIIFKIQSEGTNSPDIFNGIIEVFNGYCKTETIWKENSRVKEFKVYLNEKPICKIVLHDTWQLQKIDLSKLILSYSNTNPKYVLKNGDELKFEIESVYPGDKYKDTAISEFVTPSYGGG